MSILSAGERSHYESQGWVVPGYHLPSLQLKALQDALATLLTDNPGVRPEKLVSAHVAGDNGEGVRGQRVLVIDDVVTTGSTLRSAAHALTAAGAREVHRAAVATTPALSMPRRLAPAPSPTAVCEVREAA